MRRAISGAAPDLYHLFNSVSTMFKFLQVFLCYCRASWRLAEPPSQPPIIRRAGAAMSLLNIHLGNPGIMLDHFQRAMPKQGLQSELIAAGTQIGDGKRVPTMPSSA